MTLYKRNNKVGGRRDGTAEGEGPPNGVSQDGVRKGDALGQIMLYVPDALRSRMGYAGEGRLY